MTSPTLLVLVRPGESTWLSEGRFRGRGDVPLTDLGRRQATAVGARLAAPAATPTVPVPDKPPVAIWHSPLRRATETAQAIHQAREADAPLRPLQTLIELSLGEWEGLTLEQVRAHYPRQLQGWLEDPTHHHAPGGESFPAAFERAERALVDIRSPQAVIAAEPPVAALVRAPRRPPRPSSSSAAPSVRPSDLVLGYERPSHAPSTWPEWGIVVTHDGILRCLTLALLHLPLEHVWSFPFWPAAISVLDLGLGVPRFRAHNLDEHLSASSHR